MLCTQLGAQPGARSLDGDDQTTVQVSKTDKNAENLGMAALRGCPQRRQGWRGGSARLAAAPPAPQRCQNTAHSLTACLLLSSFDPLKDLHKQLDEGFSKIQGDLEEVKNDLKKINVGLRGAFCCPPCSQCACRAC